jgi:AcrR family transcriptional regulator
MSELLTDGAVGPPAGERPRHPGRPRSEAADRAILAAALDALVEEGFESMTIEGVALRARVGKATIYRRWASKLELVLEAANTQACARITLPDTGNIRTDLLSMLEDLRTTMAGPDGKIAAAFIAERLRHPALAEGFQRQYIAERRSVMRQAVERAVARGELPASTDAELLADVGTALIWQRLFVTGAPLDEDLPQRIVAQFFRP